MISEEIKNEIINKMQEGWSYYYSCRLVGLSQLAAVDILKNTPDLKLFVDNKRKERKRNGGAWTRIY